MRLTPEQLDGYLARIGVAAPATADLAALTEIHRGHAYGFTWETLDAFMGWPSSLHPHDAYVKMVEGGRGGWCYEMNGLLGAALSACGFAVTRLCGGVRRADIGENAVGNHLTLRVDLDEPFLAEAGLGDALVEPIPLALGAVSQGGFNFAIEQADGDWLRFHNHSYGAAPTFDFQPGLVDEATLGNMQRWLMEDAGSPFTGNLIIQRHYPGRIECIRNIMRRTVTADGVNERPIADKAEFSALLRDVFALDVPETDAVWEKVSEVGQGTFN